jgi:gliding motility-associated-like protein
MDPIFRIVDSTRIKGYAETSFGCADSAFANINVFPLDIYLTTNAILCSKNDSLVASSIICLSNGYSSLKQNIEMRYFDADTTVGPAKLLGTATILRTTAFNNLCLQVRHRIKMTTTGKVFAYINSDLKQFESNLGNNSSNYNYVPFSIDVPVDDMEVLRGVPTQLSIINGGEKYKTLLWTPSNQLSCSTCPDPVLKGNSNTLLTVVGTSEYLCRDTATIKVNVFWQKHLILPNVFTPDGDGLNDNFYVIAGKDVKLVKQFQVFNRWGQKVFERTNGSTNDYAAGWNGMFKGLKAPMGTYVYLIVVELQDGSSETYKGNITLIR